MAERRTIGQILMSLGRISEQEVAQALEYQRDQGGYFGEALLACQIISAEELDKEKAERNLYQLERDKIQSFWQITKSELAQKEAELRNKDRDMEELEERHQREIKVYKQKVKHLLYEHQTNIPARIVNEPRANRPWRRRVSSAIRSHPVFALCPDHGHPRHAQCRRAW